MADLLVHFASAFAGGRALRDGRIRAILYVGVCLPDFLYKGLLYGTGAPNWLCEPTHSPIGLLAFCYAGALLFEPDWRKRAFAALLAGAYLHILLDLAKNYDGAGVIPWAFPFSLAPVELGWYHNEDSIFFMLPALAVVGLIEWSWRGRSRAISGGRAGSP